MLTFLEKLKSLLPGRKDSPDTFYFKVIIYVVLGVIAVMIVVSALTFFLNLDTLEQTKVPDVLTDEYKNVDMIDAILDLQERGLTVKIQVKHSTRFAKGLVIDQRPRPGALVKVGRHVTLTVSRGSVMDKVGNYVGRDVNDVRLEIQGAFASSRKPLLVVQEPILEEYDDVMPLGDIIKQEPESGTKLVENKVLDLVLTVSKGPDPRKKIDSYIGLDFVSVLDKVAKTGIPFLMKEEDQLNGYKAGVITFQKPEPGEPVALNSVIEFKYNKPASVKKGMVYGRYEYMIRTYDVPVPIRVVVSNSEGTKEIFAMNMAGGELNIPYILEEKSEILLYVLDAVVDKYTVTAPEKTSN